MMPCDPEKKAKLDAMMDSYLTARTKKDTSKGGIETEQCAIAGDSDAGEEETDSAERPELRQGALSKQE
jgi:hypothetical protein